MRYSKNIKEFKIEYHGYQLRTGKKLRVVNRGLHPETEVFEIKHKLPDLHLAVSVTNIQLRKKLDAKSKNCNWSHVKLRLFFVNLEPQANNKDIYEIKNLGYHKIELINNK